MLGASINFFRLGYSIDRILVHNYKSVVAAQDMKEALERMDSATSFFLAGQQERARRQYERYRPRFEAAYQVEANNITEAGEKQIVSDIGLQFAGFRQTVEKLLYARPAMPTAQAFSRMTGRLQDAHRFLEQRLHRAERMSMPPWKVCMTWSS